VIQIVLGLTEGEFSVVVQWLSKGMVGGICGCHISELLWKFESNLVVSTFFQRMIFLCTTHGHPYLD